ncbi:MAG: hypothetical protein KA275_02815 [Chitinophagaceae bacterium]|nr:hypothetical protein [Chitinophagaceae bacterium]
MEVIKDKIIKTYIISMEVEMLSTFCIGSGESNKYDIEVVKLPNGMPYIPFTAWMGALKHYFYDAVDFSKINKKEDILALHYFWGDSTNYLPPNFKTKIEKEDIPQSHFVPEADFGSFMSNTSLNFRDGILLDNNKQVLNKYDFETVEAGAIMKFVCKLDIRENVEEEILQKCLHFIENNLKNVTIGAKTNSGLGKQKLKKFECFKFDFNYETHQKAWFRYLYDGTLADSLKENSTFEGFELINKDTFTISTILTLEDTLLNGGGIDLKLETDKQPYKNKKGELLLRGETWKGAIRAKMKQIGYAMLSDEKTTNGLIDKLFGFVSEDPNDNKKQKGRISANESIIENANTFVHHRVAIDHFTGGTKDGAKYDAEVIQHKDEQIKLSFSITNYEAHEPIWLLRAVIDLLLGDIAIGADAGIGRGRMKGNSIYIIDKKETIKLELNKPNFGLQNGNLNRINTLQTQFIKKFKNQTNATN